MSEKKLTAPSPARGELELDTAVPEEEETVTTTSSVVVESPKRRKVEAGESESPPSAITELNRSSLFIPPQHPPSRKEKKDSAAISRLSFQAPSTASSEEECFKSADLDQAGCYECDNSSEINTVVSSPESEVCVDLPEMESQSIASTTSRSVVYEAPTAEEIEEFFSAAEKIEAQRFKEKYNYDIVNDVPVEGRFQWSRVKQ